MADQVSSVAAARLAESLLSPLGNRWRHVQAVATRADELLAAVSDADHELLIAAAWLHDIGYSPEIGLTGFHPLDGARYLETDGWPADVVSLVAHHSGARFEAVERGLSAELAAFPLVSTPVLDALDTADLTTGPTGERLTYATRIAEILSRYPPEHPVHRTWTKAAPTLEESVRRTEKRLADQPR